MGNDHRNAPQHSAPNVDGDSDGINFSSALARRLSPDPTWTSRPQSESTMAGDNEIVAEAFSQWRIFAIESAVRSQLLEEGMKQEEIGDHVGDLMRDGRFLATFSKVSLHSYTVAFEQRSGQNFCA